ncbi:hypothetical protein [Rhodopila sp.]|jgi:hypothetical protein|uniref:hypothetical protein n=1 Tax=Rhodopila sp. TaxID=2480087 RepID=UPI002C55F6ED|nr:hypothetical protein [Rhodopila sp.]HVZ09803.1 hypothetical protein [Rhodopila sp.]
MEYVCDAPDNLTWFRLVSEGEAAAESADMRHAVEKHFRRERERAAESFQPSAAVTFIEQDINKEAYIKRAMPLFLTLRDENGAALVTAMLPPGGQGGGGCIIVGPGNADPYPDYAAAIAALGRHFGLTLDRASCYPYRR